MKNPPLHRYATRPGLYFTDDGGADAVVRSETADQVWFCVLEPLDQPSAFYADAARLFNEPGLTFIDQAKKQRICTRRIPSLNLRETLFRMDGPNYGLWYVHVPQAWDGMQYGYRVNGPWDPDHGVSFNPYKLLLDPYAKGIEGSMKLDPGAFAYECEIVNGKVKGSPFGPMSTIDSVGRMPVSVAIDDRAIDKHVGEPSHPHVPWSKTVIYELQCQRFHRQRAMAAQRTSRHLRGPRTPGHALIPAGSGRHLHRTAADPSQTIGTLPAGTRMHQLLGILHTRIFRPRILICHQTLARGRSGRSTARSHRHGARIARGRL